MRVDLVIAAVVTSAGLGCALDRTGLGLKASPDDAGMYVVTDVRPVPDAPDVPRTPDALDAPDAPHTPDAPDTPDAKMDVPVETGSSCNPSSAVHPCGNACVSNQNVTSCGPVSCTPCPAPANGTATCDGTSCGFSCGPGFMAQGSACVPACTLVCDPGATTVTPPGGRFTGRTTGASTASGSCGGGSAPEHIYKLVLTVASDVFVTTHGTAFDSVIYIRRGCCGAEVACNDNADGRRTSVLSQPALQPGTYYIFVDGATAAAAGAYTVDIYATAASGNAAEACGRPLRISNTQVSGNTCGYADDYSSTQDCTDVTNSGPDAVFYFVLDAASDVTFNTCTRTCFDSVLYTREVCTSNTTQGACDDDSCSAPETCTDHPTQSRVTDTLGPGVHYLIVDTYPTPPLCGPFTVTPTGVPP